MFNYTNSFQIEANHVKSVIIDQSIHGLSELFEQYRVSLQIPYSTMTNFAAFRDVMTELDWVTEEEIRIYHESLPSLDEQSLGCYIDVLNLIDVEWGRYEERADIVRNYMRQSGIPISPNAWINKSPKTFNVFFKKEDDFFVKKMLKFYSENYWNNIYYDEKGLEHLRNM